MSGKIYLIPTTLGSENPYQVLPSNIKPLVQTIKFYFVENSRSARRFLKKIDQDINIDELTFLEINKRTRHDDMVAFIEDVAGSNDIGVISEAGCPGVADPGAEVVKTAHKKGLEVVPLVGPSSILLSLMASGMNGQSFSFDGYIPIKHPGRGKTLKFMEQDTLKRERTHIFIETPYRNNALMADMVKSLDSRTLLCVACDITLESEFIKTQTIGEWKNDMPDLHKRPAIFLIGR